MLPAGPPSLSPQERGAAGRTYEIDRMTTLVRDSFRSGHAPSAPPHVAGAITTPSSPPKPRVLGSSSTSAMGMATRPESSTSTNQFSTIIPAREPRQHVLDSLDTHIREPNENQRRFRPSRSPILIYDRRAVATLPAPEKQLVIIAVRHVTVPCGEGRPRCPRGLAAVHVRSTRWTAWRGVTKRRVNQLLQSLKKQGLIHINEYGHVLSEKASHIPFPS